MGPGAHGIVQKATCNIGVIEAGVKVNVAPGSARIEADIRLPVGCDKETVAKAVDAVLARYPQIEMEEQNYMAPSWCDPYGEMVGILQDNVEALAGVPARPDRRPGRHRRAPVALPGDRRLRLRPLPQPAWASATSTCPSTTSSTS